MENKIHQKHYKQYIDKIESAEAALPLVHMCDAYAFRQIVTTWKIEPTLCDVFNENLSYFFYGRPSYRINDGGVTQRSHCMFPVCFIIDALHFGDVKRIYPFDSGAFSKKLYKDYVHPKTLLDDFDFSADFEFVGKFVKWFYGSNENYFGGTAVIKAEHLPSMAFELHSLLSMVTSQSGEQIDDRCFTIELQKSESLELNSNVLKAVVLPSSMLDDDEVATYLFDNGIIGIHYESSRTSPSSLTPLVIEKVRSFYLEKGYL